MQKHLPLVNRPATPLAGLLVCFLFLFLPAASVAQNEAKNFHVDSTLYSYYQRCQADLTSPIVLQMADTLYRLAALQEDRRMQAVAICTKLDYHYFMSTAEDSIRYYTEVVKQFAKKTAQPKYYYFAWANRLILYYLKAERTNMALYEAEQMLQEAQKEADNTGLQQCYNIMAQIYSMKGLDQMALEWLNKEAELTEVYGLENYNLSQTYAQMAGHYIAVWKAEQAMEALKKAVATAFSPAQEVLAKLEYVNYYAQFNDLPAARRVLEECRTAFRQDKRLEAFRKQLYNMETIYYRQTGQYRKALEASRKQEEEETLQNERAQNGNHLLVRGRIYHRMGNAEEAAAHFDRYISLRDSIDTIGEQTATSEFATLLNVARLQNEKQELMLKAQRKESRNKSAIIILLVALASLLYIFLYRESRFNRRLKQSEAELRSKNEALVRSQAEASRAREIAEANDRMKTTFIQAMSHEIRTPLNSIVGFSQVLNDQYSQAFSEAKEFIEIIESNCDDLLRIITDILTLSELDSYERLPADIRTDVNMICELAYESACQQTAPGVAVRFEPERGQLFILSAPERLSQLLNNLVHNAAKFTTQGSICISYEVCEEQGQLRFIVADTGEGIPAEMYERVFERFGKVNAFTQGTGLGLPICRGIAEKLGGTICIDSSYTAGCRMVVTLPLTYA